MKIMASGPITSWQIDGETMETVSKHFNMNNHGFQLHLLERAVFTYILFNSSMKSICPFSPIDLLVQSFICISMDSFLFVLYIGFNPVSHYEIYC